MTLLPDLRRKKQLVLFQKRRIALILAEEEMKKQKQLEGKQPAADNLDDDLEIRLAAKIEQNRLQKQKAVGSESVTPLVETSTPTITSPVQSSTVSSPFSHPATSPKWSSPNENLPVGLLPSVDLDTAEREREEVISNQLMAFTPLRNASFLTPKIVLEGDSSTEEAKNQPEPKSIFIRVCAKVI